MPVDDPLHPDFVPSIFSRKAISLKSLKQKQNRLARAMKRKELKQAAVKAGKQTAVNIAADKPEESTETVVVMASATSTSTAELQCDLGEPESPATSQPEDDTATSSAQISPTKNFADKATQTDFPPFGVDEIDGNNDKIKFYTGLPSWEVFCMYFLF